MPSFATGSGSAEGTPYCTGRPSGCGAGPADAAAVPSLDDVIEHDPRYVVGISYPAGAAADPGLARALHAYAEAARGELRQQGTLFAGQGRRQGKDGGHGLGAMRGSCMQAMAAFPCPERMAGYALMRIASVARPGSALACRILSEAACPSPNSFRTC